MKKLNRSIAQSLNRCRYGFTLIETLITLSLLGIILTVGIIKFGEMVRKTKINTAKSHMYSLKNAIRQLVSDRGASTACMRSLGYGTEQPGNSTYRWKLELIDGYDADVSSAPGISDPPDCPRLKGWYGPYTNEIPVDPWNTAYEFHDYSTDNTRLSAIVSMGPDKEKDMDYTQTCKNINPPDKTGFSIVYKNDNPANKNNFDIVLWME
ncbi:MAG: type II secretion system protein GspG [Elusimicrobiota bacterium]